MRVLVTGGAGFIGSAIVKAYVDQGLEVTVVDNLVSGRRENVHRDATFHELDILSSAMEQVFATGHFDAVNHHAAHVSVRDSLRDPSYDAQVNVHGTLHLLDLASQFAVPRFIYASSVAAYGEPVFLPVTEEHHLRPLSPYGIAKCAAEQYVSFFGAERAMITVSLRYANVYGPQSGTSGEGGVVSIFVEHLLRGEAPTIFGDGEQTRDFVSVDDIVRANVLALSRRESLCCNISTGCETPINALYELLQRLMGASLPARREPALSGEIRRMVLSNERARTALGWRPLMSLADGLPLVVERARSGRR